jgi:hypothetical protein
MQAATCGIRLYLRTHKFSRPGPKVGFARGSARFHSFHSFCTRAHDAVQQPSSLNFRAMAHPLALMPTLKLPQGIDTVGKVACVTPLQAPSARSAQRLCNVPFNVPPRASFPK